VILALLGNMVGHYFSLRLVEELHGLYRVIGLSVPSLPEFPLSPVGLATILEYENVSCCDAIGHSNGGVHIQGLVGYRPSLVDKIVFSHSLTSLSVEDAYTTNDTEVALYRKAKTVMKILPASILLNAMGGKFANGVRLKSGGSDTEMLRRRIKAEIKLLGKSDVLGIIGMMEDFLFHHTFSPDSYRDRANRVLLLNCPGDKIVNPRQKTAMRQLCPGAKEYAFERGGHTPMLAYPEEYYGVVRDFLQVD
jgi:pimeloyl-ACP methyl ester carboxylesterase